MLSSRGYLFSDSSYVLVSGLAAGYTSVLVFALYVAEVTQQARFAHPYALWGCCAFLLLWIARVWFIAIRGQMHSDPVVFAVGDSFSRAVALLFCSAFAYTAFAG